jgi:hypothetical protein
MHLRINPAALHTDGGPEEAGGWRRWSSEELHSMIFSLSVIKVIKLCRMKLSGRI